MSRPPAMPAAEKLKVVLSVLSGDHTIAEAARKANVSEQSVGNWKRQFLEGGRASLEGGDSRTAKRERELRSEIAELKTALGEAYVQLRVRRRGGEYRSVPFQTSKPSERTPGSPYRGSAESWASRGAPTHVGRRTTPQQRMERMPRSEATAHR
ncbi:helix-turn-helix domain-containing protein [Streptomyces sp. AJS327]|uniref:helix-turn-helix domain-containing protein n=1 Tax=Streptomyces sp. AJS327 TaxID=2545265 RepID=UPI0015DEFFBD|nr:helix-turn-helix domain-containing protein [Streptomyces sp. AJS327]MBA0053577.1 helix-turn-helix domain-containing protein [Streptomyces sp. AJS327]